MLICGYNVSPELFQILANLAVIAGVIFAVRQYRINLFSQKFQNAQTLIRSFYQSLEKGDIQAFRDVIVMRGESAGGDNAGHYLTEDGQLVDFSVYFAEGAPDNGALDRIVNSLERVCYFAKESNNVNVQFFYSELGQFLNISHEILEAMSSLSGFENIQKCFNELKHNYPDIPIKIIGYIE